MGVDCHRAGTRAAPIVHDNVDGGASNQMLILRRSGTNRLELGLLSASTYAEVKASTSGWDLRLTGDEVHVNTPNSTGTIAQFMANGTSRLSVDWDGTTAQLITAHALHVEAQTDVTIHFGKSTATTSQFKIKHTTSGSAEREDGVFQWYNGDNGSVEGRLDPHDANDDCYLELGIDDTTRGRLRLNREQGVGARPGVLVLQDQDGNDHYLWVYDTNTGGTPYELRVSTTDPVGGAGGTTIASWA